MTGAEDIGWRWADGLQLYTGYFHMIQPNSISCSCSTYTECWTLVTTSSYHPGGVNVLMLDGSTRFIGDGIDTGNPTMTVQQTSSYRGGPPQQYLGPSPYGIWGAMGTSRSGEQGIGGIGQGQ